MSRFAHAVWLAVAVGPVPPLAHAQVSVNVQVGVPSPPPVVLAVPPPLVVVADVPGVHYAPAAQVDLFFFDKRWYYWHGGYWFAGPTHTGPWVHVVPAKVPRALIALPAKYYKVPPGHLKHPKKGPPGHVKRKGKDGN
jgi:hypothetical protein